MSVITHTSFSYIIKPSATTKSFWQVLSLWPTSWWFEATWHMFAKLDWSKYPIFRGYIVVKIAKHLWTHHLARWFPPCFIVLFRFGGVSPLFLPSLQALVVAPQLVARGKPQAFKHQRKSSLTFPVSLKFILQVVFELQLPYYDFCTIELQLYIYICIHIPRNLSIQYTTV